MLAEEIEQLELAKAQAQKQEEQKERGGVVGSTEEESEKEEQEPPRLPSGDLFTAWLPDSLSNTHTPDPLLCRLGLITMVPRLPRRCQACRSAASASRV